MAVVSKVMTLLHLNTVGSRLPEHAGTRVIQQMALMVRSGIEMWLCLFVCKLYDCYNFKIFMLAW